MRNRGQGDPPQPTLAPGTGEDVHIKGRRMGPPISSRGPLPAGGHAAAAGRRIGAVEPTFAIDPASANVAAVP